MDRDLDLVQRAEHDLGYSRERFPSGEYRFEAWYVGLRIAFRNVWHNSQLPGEWKREKGGDGYAVLAEAILRLGEAEEIRGHAAARHMTPEAWELYHLTLDEANAQLEAASASVKAMGGWHDMKLEVVFQHPDFESERLERVKAAVAAWPDYLPVYTTPMKYSHPERGGSFELMDAIARYALENTRQAQGAAMYAKAYIRFFSGTGDGRYTLRDTRADWPLMKQGFRDMEAQENAPAGYFKSFASLACQMRDREEARRLYAVYDARRGAPAKDRDPDPCRLFAMSGG